MYTGEFLDSSEVTGLCLLVCESGEVRWAEVLDQISIYLLSTILFCASPAITLMGLAEAFQMAA